MFLMYIIKVINDYICFSFSLEFSVVNNFLIPYSFLLLKKFPNIYPKKTN